MAHENPRIHEEQPVLTAGVPLHEARAAVIMIHGRGASARDILTLGHEFDVAGVAFLAPQAAHNTWYPYSFLAPVAQNEPFLSSALAKVEAVLQHVQEAGMALTQTALLGFSQGACLACEYTARNPRPYGAVVGLSGGVIGAPGALRHYDGSLSGTPVFLGCSDVDPHIPVERVHETAGIFERLGAYVTKRIYRGMGHTVNQDEIDFVQSLLQTMAAATPADTAEKDRE